MLVIHILNELFEYLFKKSILVLLILCAFIIFFLFILNFSI